MPDDQREALKERIREQRDALRAAIAEMEETTEPVEPDMAIGRLSRLDNMLNQEITRSSLNQAKERQLGLERALQRIDEDPDFGECAECGEPIPIARLLAVPESELCVSCAE
jgi:DnaK suppressor protein